MECKRQEEKFTALCTLYGVVSIGQAMIFCHVSFTGNDGTCVASYTQAGFHTESGVL